MLVSSLHTVICWRVHVLFMLFVCSGVKHVSTIWVTWRVSYKKQELNTLLEYVGSPSVSWCGQCCSFYYFSVLCCVCFCLFCLSSSSVLCASLDCPFLIDHSVFYIVYSSSNISLWVDVGSMLHLQTFSWLRFIDLFAYSLLWCITEILPRWR
jgi:hypothetical protein